MWNCQRIICIWICCVSCMFGTTQLSSLVRAVPYEYFDDNEQSFYDLDTEQIQAKYDTRLLSKQMLQTEKQQQQHLENLKDFHNPESVEKVVNGNLNDVGYLYVSPTTTKLKSNDGHTSDADERDDLLEETATKAAALTSTITETLDELYLPRAASCFTNGQKFTHGQKVPRLDNCEVCLCMDGEIFCWWEKCDKKPTKASTSYDDYSTPFEESSTKGMQLNPKTTFKMTLNSMKKDKPNQDYKYDDDDDSAEIHEMQHEYEGLKEQLMQIQQQSEQHKIHNNKQKAKEIIFQQQQKEKHNKNLNEQHKNKKKKGTQEQRNTKQQKQHKSNELFEQHHHAHNHNNNRNNNHNYSLTGSSSKILNFPENLPSVLYYDYKTEEHHQHQHQHREQHLKHQKQKQQQQHEKELKHQQQQQQQQQQQIHKNHVNRHHEYGQDFNTYSNIMDKKLSAIAGREGRGGEEVQMPESRAGGKTNLHNGIDGPSTTFKYLSNGNENIYNGYSQTDSDILPEPPTKKPKFLTSNTDTTTATAKTTGSPISQLYRKSISMMTPTAGTITKSTTFTRTLTNTSTASMPLKKQIVSPWDYNKENIDKINKSSNNNNDNNNNSSEDIINTDHQDDAFHRWLTSTETNSKNNFTLNDAIIGRDDGGLDVDAGGGGFDFSNNDYIVEDRNYENIDLETDTGPATIKTKTKEKGMVTTATNAFNMVDEIGGEGAASAIYSKNSQKPKYEKNFSYKNNDDNVNSNNMANINGFINSNGEMNNKNIPLFSSISYENSNRNKDSMEAPTSSRRISSSTASSEDSGVASVVNIDILLTASSAVTQQQKPQQTNTETTNLQQQLHLNNFEHEEQLKFMQPPVSISNTNDADNNNSLYSIINGNTRNLSSKSDNNNNTSNIFKNSINIQERPQLQDAVVNLSNSVSSMSSLNLSSSNANFNFNHNATSVATPTGETPPPSTTLSPERQCNVMGTLYKIGDILPQDTGNCLQCICIDGSTSDDTPRVTCSPHNCPPLVLPDLFDATGY